MKKRHPLHENPIPLRDRFALTVDEAVDMSGLSVSSLYRLMRSGQLAYETVMGRRHIRPQNLDALFGPR
jgi:predicted DNA-binding transcriptional regulator AlpA